MTQIVKITLLSAVLAVAAVSCKKDTDENQPSVVKPQQPITSQACRTTKISQTVFGQPIVINYT